MKLGISRVLFTDTFMPYHVFSLSTNEYGSSGPDWFENVWFDTVGTSTLDVRIFDVRGISRNVALVDTGIDSTGSEFWLIHHKESQFDAEYGGEGLAVWHVSHPTSASRPQTSGDNDSTIIDLELVTGKFTSISPGCPGAIPSPDTGFDQLECDDNGVGNVDDSYKGGAGDFWTHAGADTFGVNSNPNTNDYADSAAPHPQNQTVPTGISIHDIRLLPPPFSTGPKSKDYYVDVIFGAGSSSPYIYTWRGKNFPRFTNVLAGLGYHGEPDPNGYDVGVDFVAISDPRAHYDEEYTVKIHEDGRSTTYLDQVGAFVVDHPAGTRASVTSDGHVTVYEPGNPPETVLGLPQGVDPDVLGVRGRAFHGDESTELVLTWASSATADGVVLSYGGQASNDMLSQAGLVVEKLGAESWESVRHLPPRAGLIDALLSPAEVSDIGAGLSLRVRWLGIHALDYAAVVECVDSALWSRSTLHLEDAEIAYKGSRLTELAGVDESFAVLRPGDKLTLTFPYFPSELKRTLVLETHGYFVTPSSERSGHRSTSVSRIIASVERTRPNPFNPTTHIKFTLNVGAIASLEVYSVDGHLVRLIHEGPLASGSHEFDWDGRLENGAIAPSGSYFYKLVAGTEVATGKMFLLK